MHDAVTHLALPLAAGHAGAGNAPALLVAVLIGRGAVAVLVLLAASAGLVGGRCVVHGRSSTRGLRGGVV